MRNKKIFLTVLFVIFCMCLAGFAACSPPPEDEHIFEKGWSMDETHHWHKCILEGCEEKQDYEEHEFIGDNGSDATCTAEGTKIFTCKCGATRGPEAALGHEFSEPEYVWSDDNLTCTATRECLRQGCGEIQREKVNATGEITQRHSCDPAKAEQMTYTTESFRNDAFRVQTKTIDTKPAGHSFTQWAYDETEHWHICATCGSEDHLKTAHEFNEFGICECGQARAISLAKAKAVTNENQTVIVRGIVIGTTGNYDGGYVWLLLKDETSNEVCGIRKNLESEDGGERLLCGGASYRAEMYFELGDIVELPVRVKINTATNGEGGEHGKVMFRYLGESFTSGTKDQLVEKYRVGHTDSYLLDQTKAVTVIDSQEDLETFVTTPGFQWQLVILRGTKENPLKAVTGAATTAGKGEISREYIRFFYDDPKNLDEQKINNASPALSNFGNLFNLDKPLSEILFGQTEYSETEYTAPLTFEGDIYCMIIGGSTRYYHFIVLDPSGIQPSETVS